MDFIDLNKAYPTNELGCLLGLPPNCLGNYHYTVMPFDLKSARVKYQSMVTQIFTLQIGGNKQDYKLAFDILRE